MITPLVTGRGGPFQRELVAALRRAGFEVGSDDVDELDLDDRRGCHRMLVRSRADIVVDCSGADDTPPGNPVPAPEQLLACENLAAAAAKEGVHTVLISSGCVFGRQSGGARLESDQPSPDTPLAATLVAVERASARANPDHTIVRSGRLYGRTWNSPFDDLISRAETKQPLIVARRRISPPTYGPHLASILVSLVRRPCHGIIHRTAGGVCDELELARSVLALAGMNCGIEAAPESGRCQAERPVFLTSCRQEVPVIPHWRIGLRACALERNQVPTPDPTVRAPAG